MLKIASALYSLQYSHSHISTVRHPIRWIFCLSISFCSPFFLSYLSAQCLHASKNVKLPDKDNKDNKSHSFKNSIKIFAKASYTEPINFFFLTTSNSALNSAIWSSPLKVWKDDLFGKPSFVLRDKSAGRLCPTSIFHINQSALADTLSGEEAD